MGATTNRHKEKLGGLLLHRRRKELIHPDTKGYTNQRRGVKESCKGSGERLARLKF